MVGRRDQRGRVHENLARSALVALACATRDFRRAAVRAAGDGRAADAATGRSGSGAPVSAPCPGCAARDTLLRIIARAWRAKHPTKRLLELFDTWPGGAGI